MLELDVSLVRVKTMQSTQQFPILIAYPRRDTHLLLIVSAAIGLSVSAGGLLGQILNGAWASVFTMAYLVIFALCYVVIHRGLKQLAAAMKPVVELNDEEIIHFPSETRIGWANIVDLAQRRSKGLWVISIRHLREEEPDIVDTFDLPLSGMSVSGHRLGRNIRQRFAAFDGADEAAMT